MFNVTVVVDALRINEYVPLLRVLAFEFAG
jgi:hypothetical protein